MSDNSNDNDEVSKKMKPRRSSFDRFVVHPEGIRFIEEGTGEPVQLVRNKNYKGDSKQEKS